MYCAPEFEAGGSLRLLDSCFTRLTGLLHSSSFLRVLEAAVELEDCVEELKPYLPFRGLFRLEMNAR